MSNRNERLSLRSGYALPLIMLIGMLMVGFVPPHPPSASAETIAALFAARGGMAMPGLLLLLIASILYIPFSVAIGFQMMRIEGRRPILSVLQMFLGLATAMLLVLAVLFWAAALFRGDRDPQLVLLVNDLGWITFLWPFPAALLQYLAVGLCILSDKNSQPLLPRWLGYFSLWTGAMLPLGAVIPLFRVGPFAWNGLLGFWVPALFFFTWIVLVCAVLDKAMQRILPGE